jgi:hypothetical protein
MRRYGLYDASRGLTTALAAGVAGLLLWVATLVGVQSTARFWESMGIVAAAGLVLALSHVVGGPAKGLRIRFSPGTFALAFLPVLVCVGWILMATQPGHGWQEGRMVSWSHDLGLYGLVHSLGLWHGVLAFGFGLVLGMCFDAVPAPAAAPPARWEDERTVVDEPMTAERRETEAREPQLATVGPRRDGEREPAPPETMD